MTLFSSFVVYHVANVIFPFQVIALTQDLIQTQLQKDAEQVEEETIPEEPTTSAASSASNTKFVEELTPVKHWQVGEQCQALWNKDGLYYEAKINEITTDGEVSVTFRHNGQTGVTSLGLLKISKHGVGSKTQATKKKEELHMLIN